MNYPDTLTVLRAPSPLPPRDATAPPPLRQPAPPAARQPPPPAPAQAAQRRARRPRLDVGGRACRGGLAAKAELLRSLDLWIDIGDRDDWAGNAQLFEGELTSLKVPHTWHEWSGDHSASYWTAHLGDYLRFYGSSLARRGAVHANLALRAS